jgi:hypothetical protein
MQTHDKLGRRHRERPLSTGKRVTVQARDLLWFRKLHEHGPLSSRFLYAFSQDLCRSEKRARDRLTDLFNEGETPHGGPYLTRPWQQFETLDARYQDLVYDRAPAAEAALREQETWHEFGASAGGPWRHRAMVAAITASVELATLVDLHVNFIPQHAILTRAGAGLRCSVPFVNSATGQEERHDLIPDALFGLEYRSGGQSSFRFFVVEADRGTEPTRTSLFSRKSHLRHFLQYREFVAGGLYRQHLKLTAPLLVLNVTANSATMAGMIKLAAELSPSGMTYQCFRCAPQFGRYFKPAVPQPTLLREAWERPGQPAVFLDRP